MPRDFAKAPKKGPQATKREPDSSKRKSKKLKPLHPNSPLPALLVGVAIAALVGFLVHLKYSPEIMAELDKLRGAPEPLVATSPKRPEMRAQPKAEESPAEEPEVVSFDFYNKLKENDNGSAGVAQRDRPASGRDVVEKSGGVVLQVGSFRSEEDADAQKASLALLGISSTIQAITVKEDDVWYRVMIGPIYDDKVSTKVRYMLVENEIEYLMLTDD